MRATVHPAIRLAIGWGIVLGSLALAATPAWAQATQDQVNARIEVAEDIAPFIGRPILRIDLDQRGQLFRSPIDVRSVRPGELFSAAVARRALREVLATGRFAEAAASVSADSGGVVLRLHFTPRRVVASRKMIGAAFEDSEIWREAQVDIGGELTEARLLAVRDTVRVYHVRRGFPQASVRIEARDTDNPMEASLVVEVTTGPARRIENRRVVLPDRDAALLEVAHSTYGVGHGDSADETRLDEADVRLADLLRARGYSKARVQHLVAPADGKFFLYVYVTPGPKLRLRFEGNHRFDGDQLADVIEYERETDRSAAHLAAKIQSFYRSVGFLDTEVEYQERGTAADPINDLVFKIREGDLVRVTRREFPCLTGSRTPSNIESEIDSFLEEELPGADLLGPVDPATVDSLAGPTERTGTRPAPMQPEPTKTFVATVYDKATKHVQDLYRSEGYLSALVGPVQIVRAHCHPGSPPNRCILRPFPVRPRQSCRFDNRGLPIEEPDPDPAQQCHPNLTRGIRCSADLALRIPVKLGPRASLYDLAFEGNSTLVEKDLASSAALALGTPASNVELEQARRRILDTYREEGFAFADVRSVLDLSPDHTRARARFSISESERVFVDRIIIEGAERTSESLIRRRIALQTGGLYRQSLVRKSEERIATLGTFSTVTVSLRDPYVPAGRKTVVVRVTERLPQYLDIRPGFSTGEGFRVQLEYGHRNIAGKAIQFTFRVRLGYLPDMFILDPDVRRNLDTLPVAQRLERLDSVSVLFPEVGLGPLVSIGIDGIDVRRNARDFGLTKDALSSALNYRPVRTFTTSFGISGERNDVAIFNGQTVNEYLSQPGVTADLGRLLRVPDGLTYAVAQRVTASWDRRDNPFGATRGTLLGAAVEHVRAFPASDNPNTQESDFLRTSGVVAGYVRLSRRGLAIAATVRGGYIRQLMQNSNTYPDRLFFLGGVDSLRGFLQDALVPQDIAERIVNEAAGDPTRLTINRVAIRGGDVFINPRAELRIPLSDAISTALFLDTGNVWVEPRNFDPTVLRYTSGTGLRIGTPLGPIALDYGINLARRAWEDFGAFHFSIGLF